MTGVKLNVHCKYGLNKEWHGGCLIKHNVTNSWARSLSIRRESKFRRIGSALISAALATHVTSKAQALLANVDEMEKLYRRTISEQVKTNY